MKKLTCIIIILGTFNCCSKDIDKNDFPRNITDESSLESDDILLKELHNEIVTLSLQYSCDNSTVWSFTAIGSKACGGPTGYIAYSKKINTADFLSKVNHYTKQQEIYNIKWGIISNCSLPPKPKRVECVNNEPSLIY